MTLELTFPTDTDFYRFRQVNNDPDFPYFAADWNAEFRTFDFDVQDESDADALELALGPELAARGFDHFHFSSN